MANMYWKTMAWLLTASTPKTPQFPGWATARPQLCGQPAKETGMGTPVMGRQEESRCKAFGWEQTKQLWR